MTNLTGAEIMKLFTKMNRVLKKGKNFILSGILGEGKKTDGKLPSVRKKYLNKRNQARGRLDLTGTE